MLISLHCSKAHTVEEEGNMAEEGSFLNRMQPSQERLQTENQAIGIAINKIVNKTVKSVNWTPG